MIGPVQRLAKRVPQAVWIIVALGAAYAGVRGGTALCGLSWEGCPFWIWPMVAACGYAYRRFAALERSRTRRLALLYAFLLIFFQILGRQYDFERQEAGGITAGGWRIWLGCLGAAALLAPALAWPVTELLKKLRMRAAGPAAPARRGWLTNRRFFIICAVSLATMWQVYNLAYYPGLVEYDSGYQLWQCWNRLFSASNPLFHTLILGGFYLVGEKLADPSAGIAAFCLAQRLFVACCVSYALCVLRRNRAPGTLLALSTAFFGAMPVFGMLSISCTKDVPFYSLVLVQMAMIFDGCRNAQRARTRSYWVRLGLVTALAALFRANALTAMFAIAPLVGLACRNRDVRRNMAGFMMAGVTLAYGVNALLIAATGAERPLLRESLSVPIIQLARVDKGYPEVDEELTDHHAGLVSTPLTYIPYVADLSKWAFTVDRSNIGEFAALWVDCLKRYPGDYLDALLLINKGYWYIGDTSYAKVYGDAPEQRLGAIPSRVTPGIDTIVEACRLPGLRDHLERMYSANAYLDIPVYRLLLSPALYAWLLLFCLMACLDAGRWDVRAVARLALLYLAALLIGPCCILRYALLFMLLGPLLIGMLLTPPEQIIAANVAVRLFARRSDAAKPTKAAPDAGEPTIAEISQGTL